MKRCILAGLAGYLLWTAIWLGGDAAFFSGYAEEKAALAEGGEFRETGPLLGYLALSVVASFAAGWLTARFAIENRRGTVLGMALALLATGIAVQSSTWSQMPAWYHLSFLALLVPVSLVGGRGR